MEIWTSIKNESEVLSLYTTWKQLLYLYLGFWISNVHLCEYSGNDTKANRDTPTWDIYKLSALARLLNPEWEEFTWDAAPFLQVLHRQLHVQKSHVWTVVILDVSPTCKGLSQGGWYRLRTHDHYEILEKKKKRKGDQCTNVVIISLNNFIANSDPATPRTADDTMCVMGEVTLIESKLAMLIRKPTTP